MPAIHTKRMVRVTLDLMCYDDLELEHLNWRDILGLECDEDVHATVKEYDIDW